MIVGNAPPRRDLRNEIDGADIVIRFNDCRTHGGDTGTRSDIVAVCNTGRPAKSMLEGAWRDHPAVRSAEAIWCVRNPEAMASRRASILERRPDLDDFFDDRTAELEAVAATRGADCVVLPAEVHDRLDERLGAIAGDSYVLPSTGLFAIDHVLHHFASPADRVAITGFDHEGWEGHPFSAERQLVDRFAAEGSLRRL